MLDIVEGDAPGHAIMARRSFEPLNMTPKRKVSAAEILKDALTQDLHLPYSDAAHQPRRAFGINSSRLVEALVSAGLIAFMTVYALSAKLEGKIEDQAGQLRQLEKEINTMRSELYQPVGKKQNEGR